MTFCLLTESFILKSEFSSLKPIPNLSVFMNLTPSFLTSTPYNFARPVTFSKNKNQPQKHSISYFIYETSLIDLIKC